MIQALFWILLFLIFLPGLPLWMLVTPYFIMAKRRCPSGEVVHKYHGGGSGVIGVAIISWVVCGGISWVAIAAIGFGPHLLRVFGT